MRLAVLAGAGFFGAEVLRRPVRGARRVTVLTLVVILTITLVVESTAMASPRVVALTATTGVYLLALAAWLGGLMAFAALLVPRNPPGALERVSPRFSRFAGLSVLALTVAGTAQHLIAGGTATPRSGVLLLVEVLALVATLLLSRYAVAYGRRLAFRERYMRGFPVEPRGRRPMLGRAIGVQMVLSVALLGVAVAQLAVLPVPDGPVAVPLGDPSPTTPVATAREARPAAGDTRFVPERIDLPGGVYSAVVPVATVGNELVVPEDPTKVGWWDGSSYVGDPYGSTVIAGHVDVFDRGIGFFFRAVEHQGRGACGVERGRCASGVQDHHGAPSPAHRSGRRRGGLRHRRTASAGIDHLRRRVPAGPWGVQPQPDRGRPPGLMNVGGR